MAKTGLQFWDFAKFCILMFCQKFGGEAPIWAVHGLVVSFVESKSDIVGWWAQKFPWLGNCCLKTCFDFVAAQLGEHISVSAPNPSDISRWQETWLKQWWVWSLTKEIKAQTSQNSTFLVLPLCFLWYVMYHSLCDCRR